MLQTIEMPALTEVTNNLFIETNPQLHHIAFDALSHADVFFVRDNPRLPACEVQQARWMIRNGQHAVAA